MNGPPLLSLPTEQLEVYPTREAWEAGRRAGTHRIGASMVGRILTRPWEALEELTVERRHDAATLRAFARGHRWERMVLDEYAATREVPALPAGEALGRPPGSLVIVRHPAEPWFTCSPDAGTLDLDGPGLVECKTDAGGRGWADVDVELRSAGDYHEGLAPPAYVTQAYAQLECTGLPYVDLVCLLPRYDLRIVRVWADPDTQAEILDTVGAFRERHLVRGEPLDVDGSEACTRMLARRFPGAGKSLRPATERETEIVLRYTGLRKCAKTAAEEADQLRNELAQLLGDTYGVRLDDGTRALLVPTAGRRTVSLSELERTQPGLFGQLVSAGAVHLGEPSRQLRIYD